MSQAHRRATYEDLLAVPDGKIAQIVAGELHVHPRPASPHARVTSTMGVDIGGPFDRGRGGPGGWVILDEPELHLGEDILVPDLAAWRRERMADATTAAYFTLSPDWICEVLSRSTQALDRADKMTIYAREGVRHAWLVDPIARTLEVYRLQGSEWLRVGTWRDDAAVRAEPFDAIELELAALWIREPSP